MLAKTELFQLPVPVLEYYLRTLKRIFLGKIEMVEQH